ncbi:MAG: c-type cytochrome [Rhodanobacter sp.]|nr:MAG: c-type cytochrome [Rhodanobacter sp.]TAM15037.1 MAG: c-type cytochrome [Rhodanobacter sp.]TAM36493.1 MAG: c-type cytochrome [Rhodanobacter sp.]
MSCLDEKNCPEVRRRRLALVMFGLMMLVFIVLSGFSFLSSRGQVTPDQVSFGANQATAGKRVFQAYNCMDCHTLVGNGAYLAPDLTKEYQDAGPAWLAAFLPSAGGWPTEAALRTQLLNKEVAADAGVDSLDAYYRKYPGAKDRVDRRGGKTTFMPNLPFHGNEVGELIAYLKYTSEMDTEGWPPKVMTGTLDHRLALLHGTPLVVAAPVAPAAAANVADTHDLAEHGEAVAKDFGCLACHAVDGKPLVGPDWGHLYGAQVKLTDGSSVAADDAYLTESILKPNAKIVAGYTPGVMPQQYDQLLKPDDVKAIVAYIRSLEKR